MLSATNEDIHLAYYKIKKCGFYSHGKQQATFGTLHETLQEVASWATNMPLPLTRLFDPKQGSDHFPVYLVGAGQVGNDWVIATWNETPHHRAGVASIMLNSIVGQPVVLMNGLVNNSIPGYATYFWIASDLNVMASIRFMHNVTGQIGLRDYIRSFLRQESRYAIEAVGPTTTNNTLILGYSNAPNNIPMAVQPRFDTEGYRRTGGDREHVMANVTNITKVIRKGSLQASVLEERDLFQKAVSFMRRQRIVANTLTDNRSIRIELAYTPTLEELENMIAEEDSNPATTSWDDLGFVLKGEPSKIYWIGRSTVRNETNLPVTRTNAEIVDLELLAQELSNRRSSLLDFL